MEIISVNLVTSKSVRKEVYEVDKDGFIIDNYLANFDERENIVSYINANGEDVEVDKVFITVGIPGNLYKAKWTGLEWVEGATQEDIDKITKVEPSPPSETEQTIELLKKQNQALSKMNTELSNTNADLKQSITLHDGIISELVLKMFDEDTEVM
ncbi:hypothetical protein [Lysinibacillus agricola]|uniref:hypothetical protein n=1 Tax=Lysinibacillus agricola TaxID=2590012 RepID=UPI003C250F91